MWCTLLKAPFDVLRGAGGSTNLFELVNSARNKRMVMLATSIDCKDGLCSIVQFLFPPKSTV